MLRTRRNDRRLTVGDDHVRNGDRFQVLGPGPEDGLIVEDLTGRGRTVLPAAYLAEHAEYGWASTIDAAQGATADVGVVLVRPGMDREHLYVAMTRGRQGNHAYITPDATTDNDDHGHGHPHQQRPGAGDDPQEQAVRVLEAALARSGAQDAAHTRSNTPAPKPRTPPVRTSAQPSGPPPEGGSRRSCSAGRPGQYPPSTPGLSGSSSSAGPNASSCKPTVTCCTAPCGRPARSSKRCPGGPAGAAALSPTRSPAVSISCGRPSRPLPPWTPRSTDSLARSTTTPGSAWPATCPHRIARDRADGTGRVPAHLPGPGRPR